MTTRPSHGQLLPLLIRGLELPELSIRHKVINTLLAICEDGSADKGAISEHATSLVSTMLKNSRTSGMSSANVRISALKLLGTLPTVVRYDILHPYKAIVIRELAAALDDPKRAVRKEAVVARFKFNG
ncbi:hypothetical protein WG66_001870 [Moniliophthora roreri]|nr:hypothetical protein WG66_001870 [Moniliophthora roreri]